MKTKLLTAVIAAACANGAMALGPTVTPDVELFIGGASAQDLGLREVITSLCTDTPDFYTETGTYSTTTAPLGVRPGSKYTSFFCTMTNTGANAVPGLSGTAVKVLVHKRSDGGSAFGVAPVLTRASITRQAVDNTCTKVVVSGVADTHLYRCLNTVSSKVDAGISDVEPAMFRGVNLLEPGVNGVVAGAPGTAPVSDVNFNKAPVAALTFGPVVTLGLRNALQAAQGLTVGSNEESQMPSLSSAQVASLFAGTIASWDEFKVNGVALTSVAGVVAPTFSDVHVYRRTSGSGTQAVANDFFLNQPCLDAVAPAADNTSGTDLSGVGDPDQDGEYPAIHQAASSGGVDTGLANLESTGHWGIGFQSLEKTNAAYRFVKVDGNSPLLSNVAKTKYGIVGITSFQWLDKAKSATNGLGGTGDGAQAANKLALATKLRQDLGRDTELNTANLTFAGGNITIGGVSASGKVGFTALASNGYVLNIPFNNTKPVSPIANRGSSGVGAANSCGPNLIIGGKSEL